MKNMFGAPPHGKEAAALKEIFMLICRNHTNCFALIK